ncbi:MAG: T9SS type A sorting domain-containing protein [bacterium]
MGKLRFYFVLSLFLFQSVCYSQWVKLNGPYGGNAKTIIGSDLGLFVGFEEGHFFYLPIGTEKWQDMGKPSISFISSSTIVDSTYYFGDMYRGVTKTTDFGNTWARITSVLPSKDVYAITSKDSLILAGTYGHGLFISRDKGANWEQTINGLETDYFWSIGIFDKAIYVYSSYGIYYSTDKGYTWIKPTYQAMTELIYTFEKVGERIFVAGWNGVFVSSNYGQTWNSTNNSIFTGKRVVALCSVGTSLFAATGNYGIYKSTDFGNTWINVNSTLISCAVNGIYARDGVIYAATTGAGVLKSYNLGKTWEPYNNSFGTVDVNDIETFKNKIFVTTNGRGLCYTSDFGENWIQSGYTTPFGNVRDLEKTSSILFSSGYFGLYCLKDTSTTWENISTEKFFDFIAVNNNLFAIIRDMGFCTSTDSGKTWAAKGFTIEPNNLTKLKAVNGVLFVETYVYPEGTIYRSINNGETWSKVNGLSSFNEFALFENKIYAATGYGIGISTNKGSTWTIDNRIIGNTIFAYGNDLFVGSTEGKIYRYNKNNSWDLISNDLLPTNSSVVKMQVFEDFLFVGLENSGAYKCSLSEILTSVDENIEEIPTTFELAQNYPNPFNPSTTILFSLLTKEFVTLKIYDVLGKEIITLVNEELNAGKHSKQWNAEGLSSGIYFCNLKAGNNSSIKKMILLK